jgi:hypothetical protein
VAGQHSLPIDGALAVGPVPPHVADEVGKGATLLQQHTAVR